MAGTCSTLVFVVVVSFVKTEREEKKNGNSVENPVKGVGGEVDVVVGFCGEQSTALQASHGQRGVCWAWFNVISICFRS